MKIPKLLTLDADIVEKLQKEDNASALMNKLARQHYANFQAGTRNPLKIRTNMLKSLSNQAKLIKKETKILMKLDHLGLDDFAMRWIRGQSGIWNDEMASRYLRSRRSDITIENFKEGFDIITLHGNLLE